MSYFYDKSLVRFDVPPYDKDEYLGIMPNNEEGKIQNRIADYLGETVVALKEQNKILEGKLFGISKTLDDLFNLNETKFEENLELKKEAIIVVEKLEIILQQKKTFDFSSFLKDFSINAILMGIKLLLQNKGLLQ